MQCEAARRIEMMMNESKDMTAMTPEQQAWIDQATYEQLLGLWRKAPIGSPYFQGETGKYYHAVMLKKKAEADHVQASKKIGWE